MAKKRLDKKKQKSPQTVLLLLSRNGKSTNHYGTECIFFRYLKDQGYLPKFIKLKNAKNSDVIKLTQEAAKYLDLYSKVYVVFDTDTILYNKQIIVAANNNNIVLLPMHPCLEIVFAFAFLDKFEDVDFLQSRVADNSIQVNVYKYINTKLKQYCKNNKLNFDDYEYGENRKADSMYLTETLFPILAVDLYNNNLLTNLNIKNKQNWCTKIMVSELQQEKSGIANLCFIEELKCQKEN